MKEEEEEESSSAYYKILADSNAPTSTEEKESWEDCKGANESHLLYVMNLILSGTARLNVLLPSATILAFTIFAPILTNDGDCSALNRSLTAVFVLLCAASCAFFALTDSFRSPSGRIYHGLATPRGIWPFNARRRGPPDPERYRLGWGDLFHGAMSVAALFTFAGSHRDVVACYYPKLPRKVINSVPLAVGFVVSVFFVVFPSKRRGIGHPFLLQRGAVY